METIGRIQSWGLLTFNRGWGRAVGCIWTCFAFDLEIRV